MTRDEALQAYDALRAAGISVALAASWSQGSHLCDDDGYWRVSVVSSGTVSLRAALDVVEALGLTMSTTTLGQGLSVHKPDPRGLR